MRDILAFIMRGRIHAIGSAASLAILGLIFAPLGLLSSAIIMLVALVHGLKEGLLTSVIAAVVLAVLGQLALGNPVVAADIALKMWLPGLILAGVLYYRSLSQSVITAAILSVILVLSFFVIFDDPTKQWYDFISGEFLPALEENGLQLNGLLQNEEALQLYARLMTGAVAMVFMMGQIISLFIARSWQAKLYRPGAFAEEFCQLRLGSILAVAAIVVVLLASTMDSDLLLSLAMLGLSLFMFQGLAVCHEWIKARKLGGSWLVALYILMVFFMPYSVLLVSFLGMTDNGFDYRRRLANSPGNNGNNE